MTDKKEEKTTPVTLPKCQACGKILLHCSCSSKELKK